MYEDILIYLFILLMSSNGDVGTNPKHGQLYSLAQPSDDEWVETELLVGVSCVSYTNRSLSPHSFFPY